MIGKGNPEGCIKNIMTAKQYDKAYIDTMSRCVERASEQPGYPLIWKPALEMVGKGRLIDIGCGRGEIAEIVRTECSGIEYVMGIDYSPRAIDQANSKNPNDSFLCADIMRAALPLPKAYDVAVVLEVLEHVRDDLELLQRIPAKRRVVLSVPSFCTKGHVRWFGSVGQAVLRYSRVVQITDVVVTSAGALPGANFWTLIAGVRK